MAIAALDVLHHELKRNEDVGVVGFDDVSQSAWAAYQLTTGRQDLAPMIDSTVALLCEQMSGDLRRADIVIPCTLVERATVRR
ncbi:hypothetical protein MNJPNG_08715 [Cupriavidus oxalaticus]|uniref:substrate-binding domain-containing protein n=1 Tax=Cupriavidus oxalaticus TaxID=96344 RepID=UPI003F7371CC